MGFHLMSITCHRGHFIDTVEVWWDSLAQYDGCKRNLLYPLQPNSMAEAAGLANGDLLLKIEGKILRDLTHHEVVEMLSSLAMQGKYGDKIELVLIPASLLSSYKPTKDSSTKSEP